jgi:putative tryptophan/tyrosine transport system substrate-binding protein
MALPRAAAAQQLPVVGFLHPALVESYVSNAAGFARGLKERGFAEAQNLSIEYRFANGRLDQLEALAADLVRRSPAVIVAGGAAAAVAAKAATGTIPIVLVSRCDPASLGLAASLSRPGGNVTGVAFTTAGLMGRKLGFLRQIGSQGDDHRLSRGRWADLPTRLPNIARDRGPEERGARSGGRAGGRRRPGWQRP